MASQPIKIEIIGDASGAQKTLNTLDTDLGGFQSKAGSVLGGIGKAFVGLAAFTGGLSLFKGFIEEAREGEKIARLTENVIRSTGAAAGVTADQVGDLSTRLSNVTGIDDEVVQGASNLLLTFTNVKNGIGEGNDIFDQATQAALDMSVAFGQDANSSAIQLGKALNDPIKGVSALSRVGVSFTEQQKKQIEQMVKVGDVAGAQKVILEELGKQTGGAAEAAADPWQKFEVVMGNLKESIGTALLPTLNSVITWLAEKLPQAVETAKVVFQELKTAFTTGDFSALGERLGAGILTLRTWFTDHWPAISEALTNFVATIGAWIRDTGAPWLAEHLVEWAKKFIEWVVPMIPPLLEKLGELLVAVGVWLWETGLPWLGEHLVEWGKKFVDWVAPMIPPLLEELGKLLGRLVMWLVTEALPGILKALGQWTLAILKWVGGELVGAFMSIVEHLKKLPAKISEASSGMWDGIKESFKGALNWIIRKWNSLSFKIPEMDLGPLGKVGGQTINFPDIPEFASGGIAPSGRPVLVGEEGPELITLGKTSRVYNARDTAAMGGGFTYAPNYSIEINASDAADIEERLKRVLDEHAKEAQARFRQGLSAISKG